MVHGIELKLEHGFSHGLKKNSKNPSKQSNYSISDLKYLCTNNIVTIFLMLNISMIFMELFMKFSLCHVSVAVFPTKPKNIYLWWSTNVCWYVYIYMNNIVLAAEHLIRLILYYVSIFW